jgi:hypothetical protein
MYPLAGGGGSEQKVSGAVRVQNKDVTQAKAGVGEPHKAEALFYTVARSRNVK